MFKTWHQPGKILDRKNVYSGRVFAVDQLHIQTPDGLKVERDLIKTSPTITIVLSKVSKFYPRLSLSYQR